MNRTLLAIACAFSLVTLLDRRVQAQSVVDFRDVIRTAEPSLLTVAVDAKDVEQDAVNPDGPMPEGPRFEWLDLDGHPLQRLRDGRRGMVENRQATPGATAAFVVDNSTIIAFVGPKPGTVNLESADGKRSTGTVMAYDHVTGLAAIQVDQLAEPALILSVANPEPGMPIVATWIDDGVLRADAGMISTRPVASESGIGLTAGTDFGDGLQMAGAPVLDATGIVIGVLVPGRNGRLVCTGSANIQRLVDSASAENPSDLKRGLVGIQFEGGGPLVLEVSPNSGAEQAGIKAGDLVQRVGQLKIRDAGDVIAAVANARAGDTLEIIVRRGDETVSIPVTLTEHPQQQLARTSQPGNRQMQRAFELNDGNFGQLPMDQIFRDLRRFNGPAWPAPNQRRGAEGLETERSDVEDTLKELQRQMEQLNEKFENR